MVKSMVLQVGVKIFLRNSSGKFLLLKRSPAFYPNIKNGWDIPGGRIIPGTTTLENIKREVFEETKLPVLDEPMLISVQDIIRLPEKHIVRLSFLSRTSGEPVLNEEHLDFKWVALDEMKRIDGLDEYSREVLDKHFSEIIRQQGAL